MMEESPADGDSTVFHLQLNCTSRKSTDSKVLSLSSFPSSTLELKQAIESRFSIPVCVQSVSYQLAPLSDGDSLLERRIRSGDTLSVSYLCEADCQLIREVIEWLKNVTAAIRIEHLTAEGGANTDDIIKTGCFEAEYPTLLHKSFRWLDPKCYVNKLYFEAMGGLQAVIELYKYEDKINDARILLPSVSALVLDIPPLENIPNLLNFYYREVSSREWNIHMPPTFKVIECCTIEVIMGFGETLQMRRHLFQHGNILDMVFRSLLRKVVVRGEVVKDTGSDEEMCLYNTDTLLQMISIATYIICNLAELPEYQLRISSAPHVLDQLLSISLSEQFKIDVALVVAETFLLLAHNSDTHEYLTRPDVVKGPLEVYQMRTNVDLTVTEEADRLNVIVLRCTILVEFAQLVLTSPHLIPPSFIDVILSNMNQFLSETHPSTITKYDEEQSCIWSTLLPYVKLFYQPDHQLLHRTAVISNRYPNFRALLNASVNMGLFFLHSKVGRKCTCDVLIKEGLLDYVIALPWYVDLEFHERARALVYELGSHVQLQPPRLCSIAQAKLAKIHFGLEKVVQFRSPVDLIRSIHTGQ